MASKSNSGTKAFWPLHISTKSKVNEILEWIYTNLSLLISYQTAAKANLSLPSNDVSFYKRAQRMLYYIYLTPEIFSQKSEAVKMLGIHTKRIHVTSYFNNFFVITQRLPKSTSFDTNWHHNHTGRILE